MAESVLLIGDDELTDVRDALEELRVSYRWLRPGDAKGPAHAYPTRLLVTTARQGLLLEPAARPANPRPVCVAILDEDSKTVSARLRERGFDYLVRRPVHPIALQLLLLRRSTAATSAASRRASRSAAWRAIAARCAGGRRSSPTSRAAAAASTCRRPSSPTRRSASSSPRR